MNQKCDLCSSGEISIDVRTMDPDNAYHFSTSPEVGIPFCPLCGKNFLKMDLKKDLKKNEEDKSHIHCTACKYGPIRSYRKFPCVECVNGSEWEYN